MGANASHGNELGDHAVLFFKDMFGFLFAKRSRLIFIPFLVLLLLFVGVLVVSEGTAWAPLIYAVF